MTPKQLANVHSRLRIRARLRQEDVAELAGIPRSVVVNLEAGRIGDVRVRAAIASFDALGARLELSAFFRGAALDRVLDELHAHLVAEVVRILTSVGWTVRVEVTFSVRGERGSIDVLGWHPGRRALLVVEIKSELPGIDPLLRPLDVKVRLAPSIAHEQFGWRAASVSRLVVLPEDRTVRRLVERHRGVLGQALPARSRAVRSWLRTPLGALAGLWFLTIVREGGTTRNPSAVRRVKRPKARSYHAHDGMESGGRRLIDPHNVAWGDS